MLHGSGNLPGKRVSLGPNTAYWVAFQGGSSGTGVSPLWHKGKRYHEFRHTGETPVPLC